MQTLNTQLSRKVKTLQICVFDHDVTFTRQREGDSNLARKKYEGSYYGYIGPVCIEISRYGGCTYLVGSVSAFPIGPLHVHVRDRDTQVALTMLEDRLCERWIEHEKAVKAQLKQVRRELFFAK